MKEKIIHFGEFVRWNRVMANKTAEELGRDVGLTSRRLMAIETMALPNVQHTTMAALARVFGFDPETFEEEWQKTPVPVTRRKAGPSTDEARRFNAACAAAGTTPVEGQRRLRSWIIEQDTATQMAVLGFVSPPRDTFTDPVDHLQDPSAEVAKRVAAQASQATNPQGTPEAK